MWFRHRFFCIEWNEWCFAALIDHCGVVVANRFSCHCSPRSHTRLALFSGRAGWTTRTGNCGIRRLRGLIVRLLYLVLGIRGIDSPFVDVSCW